MRVISGIRKGHKLTRPDTKDVRPTEDRVKESLFNILSYIDKDAVVLDLFAGSGAIGIEFLSRGANKCYFIDSSPMSIKTIRENLEHTKLTSSAEVIRSDYNRAVNILANKDISFDYIYLDPPFRNDNIIHNSIESIADNELLSDDGILIVEHERELELEDKLFNLKKMDSRRYGSKTISFFKKI